MSYREYDKPLPVIFISPDKTLMRGVAIGLREKPLTNGKSDFYFLVQAKDGEPFLIPQKDVVG